MYLPPPDVLERLSGFTSDTVVEALGDDSEDSKFVRAQAGSMSSTLGFLSRETARRGRATLEQREALLEALSDLEGFGDHDADEFVADRRETVESVEPLLGNVEAVRSTTVDVLGCLQAAVADGTFGEDTPQARGVLYDHFETRVESQLRVLGREE